MSSLRVCPLFTRQAVLALILGLASLAAGAQYPGQVTKKSKDAVALRAIAVLEYTGEEGKPKTSRLVPVTVYDGQELQDANVYLARPQPLALAGEVEYELEKNGKALGLFDIKNSGQEQGSWVGYGAWKPLPVAKAEPPKPVLDDGFDSSNDHPVLHRKHPEASKDGGTGKDAGSDKSAPGAPSDPDRPALHKKTTSADTSSADASKGSSDPAPDPDRPTLHKKTPNDNSDSTGAPDPDRPTMRAKKKATAESNDHESSAGYTDPDRPRLKRGKSSGNGLDVLPSLMGLPPDMQQAVAVSDVKSMPEHPWSYTWADGADEGKMKQSLESIARDALGLKTSAPAPAPKRAAAKTKARAAKTSVPPAALVDEQFRVFELAYGSGATLVLSAHTDGPLAQQKFVTIVAQPDVYGNVLVLLKSVTDGAHLDETPRMRLVDAVDALADNRGELLFELRGATQRQFALYRVLRGTAKKLFVTGGGEYGVAGE